jgi:hypothetical protein
MAEKEGVCFCLGKSFSCEEGSSFKFSLLLCLTDEGIEREKLVLIRLKISVNFPH